MIVFELDGVLADSEHRQHFVDPKKKDSLLLWDTDSKGKCRYIDKYDPSENGNEKFWKPDWKAFYEACSEDMPIEPVQEVASFHFCNANYYQIWSGRCESVREITEDWLLDHDIMWGELKMRPDGDNTPDDKLKDKWLDEALAEGKTIDYVFDSDPASIDMWRDRDVFVFDVNQYRI